MPCGGLWSGLNDRPMVEMSLSVTIITLFPLVVRSKRDNELLVSEFGGKSCEVAYSCDIFGKVFVVCLPRGISYTVRESSERTEMDEDKDMP